MELRLRKISREQMNDGYLPLRLPLFDMYEADVQVGYGESPVVLEYLDESGIWTLVEVVEA